LTKDPALAEALTRIETFANEGNWGSITLKFQRGRLIIYEVLRTERVDSMIPDTTHSASDAPRGNQGPSRPFVESNRGRK
jgi:hypothetical protein